MQSGWDYGSVVEHVLRPWVQFLAPKEKKKSLKKIHTHTHI
jgi:hypothetical protein